EYRTRVANLPPEAGFDHDNDANFREFFRHRDEDRENFFDGFHRGFFHGNDDGRFHEHPGGPHPEPTLGHPHFEGGGEVRPFGFPGFRPGGQPGPGGGFRG